MVHHENVSQRCTSSRQMTDKIFEVETTSLAHVACSPQESGILLADFAAAHPSVNHSWIFHVLEKAEMPDFICRFLRMIYCNSTTHVEFAGRTGGQFPWPVASDKVVRRMDSYSQWLLIPSSVGSRTRSDPTFRSLHISIIPRNPAAPDFLQPVPCAYADDFAVAASSFRLLMTPLSPAFKVVDQNAGLNLKHLTCCWVQYGSESCQSLSDWVATNREEFREMKIFKYARYVGTTIGPEGYFHRWTAPRKNHSANQKINASTKSLVERLRDF